MADMNTKSSTPYCGEGGKWMVPLPLPKGRNSPSRSPLPRSEMAVKAAIEAAGSTDDGRPTRSSGSASSIQRMPGCWPIGSGDKMAAFDGMTATFPAGVQIGIV